jgi:diacylglycerol kinase (ATP)
MGTPFRRIHIVVNPASGKDQPILNTLNRVLRKYDVQWDVSITQKDGDGQRFAQAAVANGANVVAVYGGDGTVMDVANGLLESDVPLAVLPGGTGNAVLHELGVPAHLDQAAELLCQPDSQLRALDLGRTENGYFLLRAGVGLATQMTEIANREMKDRWGNMAYVMAALQSLPQSQRLNFQLTLNGNEPIECEGVLCLVCNMAHLGTIGLSLNSDISPYDGLLDVLVVNDNWADMVSVAAQALHLKGLHGKVRHWQASEVMVRLDTPQPLGIDGETLEACTSFSAAIIPQAIRVVVPAEITDED